MGTFWPLLVYAILVIALVGGIIAFSSILGERHSERATKEPYEAGIISFGSAHLRISSKFYLIGLFFVIFDLESIFVFAWSVAVRELGWRGYFELLLFVGILLCAWLYLWRTGGLNWGPAHQKVAHHKLAYQKMR